MVRHHPLRIAAGSALVASTAVAALVAVASPATADTPSKSAWYNQAKPVAVPVSAPAPAPGVASGKQLEVGATSSAALSYTVDPSTTGATLTLQIPPNSTVGTPTVNACPITDPSWTDGTDQPSSAAPKSDCSQAVVGVPSSDGTSETWSLSAPQSGTYDVALVPAAGSAPFSVVFQPPDSNSLTPQASSGAGSGIPSGSGGAPGLPSDTGGSGASAGGSGLPTGGSPAGGLGGATSQPIVPTPSGLGGSSAIGATPTRSAQTPTRSGPLTGIAATPLTTSLLSSKAQRITAFVLLLVLVVGLIGIAARPTRPPRLLGSLGSANFRPGGSPLPGGPPGASGR